MIERIGTGRAAHRAALLAALAIAAACGVAAIEGCGSKRGEELQRSDRLDSARETSSATANESKGAAIYRTKCSFCHQPTGGGLKNLYPPLAGSERVLGRPADVVRIVLNGMQGEIYVNDERYNNAMPGWRGFLPPEDIAEVVNHVRTSWGNNAPPITAAFVDSIQKATASAPDPIRAETLEK